MYPMLEMAGEKALYIPEALCVYNTINQLAVNKTRAEKQHKLMLEIRAKKPYRQISFTSGLLLWTTLNCEIFNIILI